MEQELSMQEKGFGRFVEDSVNLRSLREGIAAEYTADQDQESKEIELMVGAAYHAGVQAYKVLSPRIQAMSDLLNASYDFLLPAFEQMTGDEPYFDQATELRNRLVTHRNSVLSQFDEQIENAHLSVFNPPCDCGSLACRMSAAMSIGSNGLLVGFVDGHLSNGQDPTWAEMVEVAKGERQLSEERKEAIGKAFSEAFRGENDLFVKYRAFAKDRHEKLKEAIAPILASGDPISPRLREKLTECLAEQLAPLEFHSAIV